MGRSSRFSRALGMILLAGAAGGLVGCASMQERYQEENCNYDAAFKRGMNDSLNSREMDLRVAQPCLEKQKAGTEKGYRDGYVQGKQDRSLQDNIVAASGPVNRGGEGWGCLEFGGIRKCGYGCMVGFGKVYCGRKSTHSCVEAYGIIKCGKNCRAEYGEVGCEEY
ncbi:MAG: hypothetical protein AB7P04_11685 [Bacteriovoracia bacterium]